MNEWLSDATLRRWAAQQAHRDNEIAAPRWVTGRDGLEPQRFSGRAVRGRVIGALAAAAVLVSGGWAVTAMCTSSARASGTHCAQVGYGSGPWGTAPGRYTSCHDGRGRHVLPPDGSNDAWNYVQQHR